MTKAYELQPGAFDKEVTVITSYPQDGVAWLTVQSGTLGDLRVRTRGKRYATWRHGDRIYIIGEVVMHDLCMIVQATEVISLPRRIALGSL